MQNRGDLAHLHHEGGLPRRQVVGCTDAGKNAVHHANVRAVRGHKGADLRHERDERYLPHIGGFTSHIRAGDDGAAIILAVERRIVGDKGGVFQHSLHHGVPPVRDFQPISRIHNRARIVVGNGHLRKGAEHVKPRDGMGRALHAIELVRHAGAHIAENLVFQLHHALLRAEHLGFELL